MKKRRIFSLLSACLLLSSEILPVYAGTDDIAQTDGETVAEEDVSGEAPDESPAEPVDDREMHSVSVKPAEITTVTGGEWLVGAVADPVITPPEDGWFGARYEWDLTKKDIKDGYTLYPGAIHGGLKYTAYDPDTRAGQIYQNTYISFLTAYTPGEYEVEATLYTGDGFGKAPNKEGSGKTKISVTEPGKDDIMLLVYDTDSAVIENDGADHPSLGYIVNEDHSVSFKADCVEQDQEIEITAGENLNLSSQLNPIGDKWTNRYDDWDLTNRYLEAHNYTMEYRWEIEGSDAAKAVFVSDPAANVSDYSIINRNISFFTDAAIEEDQTVTVKAYCHYYNLDIVSGSDQTLNLDDECVKSFKITVKARTAAATELKLPESFDMRVGDRIRPEEIEGFKLTPSDAKLELSSSDAGVLDVYNGEIRAKAEGTAVLTAKSGEKSASATVTVKASEYSVSINTYNRWGWTDEDYSQLELGDFGNVSGTDYGYNIQLRADLSKDFMMPDGAHVEFTWRSDRPDFVSVVGTDMKDDLVGIANVRAWRYDMTAGTTITVTASIKDAEGKVLGKAVCDSKKIYVKGYHLGWGPGKGGHGCYMDFDVSPAQELWGTHEEGLHGYYYYLNQIYTGAAPITYTAKPSLNGEFITKDDKDVKVVSYRWFFVNGGEGEDDEVHQDPYSIMGTGQDLTSDHITIYPPAKLPDDNWYSAAVYLETTIEYQSQTVTGRQRIVLNVIPMEGMATGIEISDTAIELSPGATKSLKATVKPSDAKDKSVEWSSSDVSVATVDSNGKVTARGVGEAVITARSVSGGHEAYCSVKVFMPLTKLSLNKSKLAMAVGTEYQLTASGMGQDGADSLHPAVVYESSNEAVAKVDPESGMVNAVAAGSAKITAKARYGGKSATCTVKVTAPAGSVKLSVKKGEASVEAGKTLTLKADFENSKPADKSLVWTSEDTDIATVNEKGVVTGVSEGETVITAVPSALSGGTAGSITVKVTGAKKAREISDIHLYFKGIDAPFNEEDYTRAEIAMFVGDTFSFAAYGTINGKLTKLKSSDVVFYAQSGGEYVKISSNGKVKAIAADKFYRGEVILAVRSLSNPELQARTFIGTYQRFKSLKLNTSKANVRKGDRGVLSVSQFKPDCPSNPCITWEASSDDVKLALLPAGVKVSELKETDFTDGFVRTDLSKGESLAYLCVKASKKCVITGMTDDGTKKKVSCTLNIKGKITKLELKTGDKVVGGDGHYTVRLKPRETLQLEVLMDADYGAETKLVWSSDEPQVATVKNGKITMCKEPIQDCCMITAVTADETQKIEVKLYVDR